jgi:NitT/TauT family transport system substrate-binding protein
MTRTILAALLAAVIGFCAGQAAAEDTIKLATSRLLAYTAVPIMLDKGFLAAEGLKVELVTFDSAQPITVAVVAGDADFGVGGLSAAFYTLAGEGQLRILAGGTREMPGFFNFNFLASNRAAAAGLKSVQDLSGHTVGVTQLGTALEYSLGLAAEKYGLDLKTIRISGLQSNSNVLSALTGGQLDAAVMPGGPSQPLVAKGEVQRLAWVGDVTPGIQNNVAFASAKIAQERPDLVDRFMRAYRKAARLYHDAVADANEQRRDGPGLPELVPILAKFASISVEQARGALPWIDRDGRVDLADMRHQIAWFRAQGLMKNDVDIDAITDRRVAVALPKTN